MIPRGLEFDMDGVLVETHAEAENADLSDEEQEPDDDEESDDDAMT